MIWQPKNREPARERMENWLARLRPIRIPEERRESRFCVISDPGKYPLASGMELSAFEVYTGLRLKGFYRGTVLLDRKTGLKHTVRKVGKRLGLEPEVPDLLGSFRSKR